MNKFTVGQRVCKKFSKLNQWEDDRVYGEVLGFNEKYNTYLVKWESNWVKNKTEEMSEENLFSEEESDALYSKLEEEFNSVASQITEKMRQAAKLLDEAGDMADKAGYKLSEMYDQVSPLISSMRSTGWRTSSLSC